MADDIWPDPAGWAARLNDKLDVLGKQYHGISGIRQMRLDPDELDNEELVETDPQANATLTASATLAAVVAALRELPTFREHHGLTALQDLGLALDDVDRGLHPAMFKPREVDVLAGDTAARKLIKAYVVACVELLEAAGFRNRPARQKIATIFAAQGFRGRKGGLISAASVYDWQTSVAAHGGDQRTRTIINRAIRDWKQKRGWPPTAADVVKFAADCAASPGLQTKI